ncbi:MAG: hypothetical protein ACTSSE_14965 [Candidatus Thorarchaeota archaeon]
MTQYWVITPYDSGIYDVFEHAWKYDLANGTITIGWSSMGDISNLSKEELREEVADWRTDRATERMVSIDAGML